MALAGNETERSADGVAVLDKSQSCSHCDGEGVLRWTQPVPGPDGWVLRELEHPCPAGCGDTWKHPVAEADRVVGAPSDAPQRARGNADEANEIGVDLLRRMLRDR